jgi:hypothetical protein
MIKQLIVRIITKQIIKKQNTEDCYFLNYFDYGFGNTVYILKFFTL